MTDKILLLTIEGKAIFGGNWRKRIIFKTKDNAKEYVKNFRYLDAFWQKQCKENKAIVSVKTKYQTVISKNIELRLVCFGTKENDKTTVYFDITGYEPFSTDSIHCEDRFSFEELLELDYDLRNRLKLFEISLNDWRHYNLHYADFFNIKHGEKICWYYYILQRCKDEYRYRVLEKNSSHFSKYYWQKILTEKLNELEKLNSKILNHIEYPDFLI